jgi:alpha-glucosidase
LRRAASSSYGGFGSLSVASQERSPDSTLELYRQALALRRRLPGALTLTWRDSGPDSRHFERQGGWPCIANLGADPIELPPGRLVLASGPVAGRTLPPDTAAWMVPPA